MYNWTVNNVELDIVRVTTERRQPEPLAPPYKKKKKREGASQEPITALPAASHVTRFVRRAQAPKSTMTASLVPHTHPHTHSTHPHTTTTSLKRAAKMAAVRCDPLDWMFSQSTAAGSETVVDCTRMTSLNELKCPKGGHHLTGIIMALDKSLKR
ncbi:hypothetical protein NHX12_030931 [Muraenolepis orangiensis]|uniref:Uncharacterized protein n=1 Tax=Muraenolepis orangiensis TaxID=630683 RepID=A0A9Q0D6B6_9TELE|nr:hypothetical protein NHX12_016798 [Muraenolepis orangiensis]KAJ3581329.1 hypothetical protein NHX12_016770 [Muraenolepis orangiensis]KAJ3603188.1 hypothetical protein NHX12_030931 [Muraenolepis orangiensis]